METRIVQCAVCGAEIDLITNRCPYCSPGDAESGGSASAGAAPPGAAEGASVALLLEEPLVARPAAEPAPPAPAKVVQQPIAEDREFGLLLFEAEESLARGAADKALVLASRAVKERPESLTARALLDRARRELLRGRRREKLDTRVTEARDLLDSGEVAAAERIVTSALKLIPDHAMALELFGRIKQRRLGAGTAEAEAERELAALVQAQAEQALAAARTAVTGGRIVEALLATRRGLRHVPDHAGLLALLKELQQAAGTLEADRSRRNALVAQVRAGLELLDQGRLDESLRILRAVLREDPDNARAQAAVQEVRQAFLGARTPAREPTAEAAAPPVGGHTSVPVSPPAAPQPEAAPRPLPRLPAPPRNEAQPPERSARPPAAPRRAAPESAIPVEILLPRTRRRATPIGLILAGGLVVLALVVLVAGRGGGPGPRGAPQGPRLPDRPAPAAPPTSAATPGSEAATGPLANLDPELRRVLEATLGAYAHALETVDAGLLAKARPDMSASDRERRLAPFVGALNATTDIRVLDASVEGNAASVLILSTDVIVGGRAASHPPIEETLRFERRGAAWTLRAAAGG